MACALYDPEQDLLKTFVDSTRRGTPLRAYEYQLSQSPSLLKLAQLRQERVIVDMPSAIQGTARHSWWLREQGYRSSYTLPLFQGDVFEGFLFFDSLEPNAFTPEVTRQLAVYGSLVASMVSHAVDAVRALVGAMQMARDVAHLRDVETGAHLDRTARYARLIARGLAERWDVGDEFVEMVFLFAPLHDIGKIGVPDAVLRKPGRFTPEERRQMMAHVDKGVAIVDGLVRDFGFEQIEGVQILRNIVAQHHEMLDGSGYPRGLAGDAILPEARIVTVADIFDALSSRRLYKDAWTLDQAFDELEAMAAAGKIEVDCVAALRSQTDEVRGIMARFVEAPSEPVPTPA